MTRATATFQTGNWEEEPFASIEGGSKLSRALVTGTYSGTIEGETTFSLVICHIDDASATNAGYERIVGRLDERAGSFMLRHEGTFDGNVARTTLTIVPGSGTGELSGLRGGGTAVAPIGDKATITLDYDFA